MSFYDDASLVFLPSGGAGKDGKAYSIKPRTGDGDFTFSRGSNLTATRVDSNGLIEKGRENLLTYSNDFSNAAWSMSGSAPIGGQDGYDGSNDAWSITGDVGDNWLFRRNDTEIQKSGIQTFSIYVKKNATYGIRIYFFGTANANTYFNLSNGTIVNATNTIDSKIEPVGSDWFRCSITFEQTTTQMYLYATNNENVMLDGITHILQDAQLEIGLVATEYIESGATKGKAGILEHSPRFDYSGGASCPSLLLEPSRTQLVTQSEYFGGYSNSNSTDEPNATTSPEGLTNATSFLEAATTGQHKLTTSLSFDGSSTYTFSIFAKTNGRDLYIDTQNSNEWGGRAWFDLTNGTANSVLGTANIEDFGNGWYRCIVTGESTLAGGNLVELLTSDGSTNSTTGDITKGVFIYGAQMEQGSYPTSYIPNHSGGSVTRNTDVTLSLTNAGADGLINNYNTTIFINLKKIISVNNVIRFVTLFPNGGANNPRVLLYGNMSNALVQYRVTGQADQSITSPYNRDEVNKIAIRISGTSLTMFHNGEEVNTITIVQGDDLEYLSLAESAATDSGYLLNQLLSFPTALSDDECIALTTL